MLTVKEVCYFITPGRRRFAVPSKTVSAFKELHSKSFDNFLLDKN